MSKRAQFKSSSGPDTATVTLSYTDPETGDRLEREFSVPNDGKFHYVREDNGRGGNTQPCDALASTGSTLMATGRHPAC